MCVVVHMQHAAVLYGDACSMMLFVRCKCILCCVCYLYSQLGRLSRYMLFYTFSLRLSFANSSCSLYIVYIYYICICFSEENKMVGGNACGVCVCVFVVMEYTHVHVRSYGRTAYRKYLSLLLLHGKKPTEPTVQVYNVHIQYTWHEYGVPQYSESISLIVRGVCGTLYSVH